MVFERSAPIEQNMWLTIRIWRRQWHPVARSPQAPGQHYPPFSLPKAKRSREGWPEGIFMPAEPPWTPTRGPPYLVGSTRGHLGNGARLSFFSPCPQI